MLPLDLLCPLLLVAAGGADPVHEGYENVSHCSPVSPSPQRHLCDWAPAFSQWAFGREEMCAGLMAGVDSEASLHGIPLASVPHVSPPGW